MSDLTVKQHAALQVGDAFDAGRPFETLKDAPAIKWVVTKVEADKALVFVTGSFFGAVVARAAIKAQKGKTIWVQE